MTREEYSEELGNQFRRIVRQHDEIMRDLESTNKTKNRQELLDPITYFFWLCYHLREWILKDEKVSEEVKSKVPTFDKEDSFAPFLACRDLANKSKHAILEENYRPNDVNTKINSFGSAFFTVKSDELDNIKPNHTIHLGEDDSIFFGSIFCIF